MKSLYYTLFAAAISCTSCKNTAAEKTQADPRTIVPFTQQTATAIQNQSTQAAIPQDHNLFHEGNTAAVPSMAAGVNPAHGQPNHRCDIPVGAPLNTPANGTAAAPQTTTQTVSAPQTVSTPQVVTSKTVTPKGMNPPHGEKGHRCDISVGAPLNSKPVASTPVVTPPASGEVTKKIEVPQQQQAVPALLSTSSTNKITVEGINPAHGQEGHRCDIGVGEPLPKS